MIKETIFTPEIDAALKNDVELQQLYKELGRVRMSAIPKVIQQSETKFICKMDDEFYVLVDKIKELIELRMANIIDAYTQ